MQLLDENATADVQFAKQDKIDIEIGEWQVPGHDPSTYDLLFNMCETPVPSFPLEVSSDLTWFNRPQGNRQFNPFIQFSGRGAGGRVPRGTPLIAGRLQARYRGGGSGSDGYFALTAQLSINPTRFVRHVSTHLRWRPSSDNWMERIDSRFLLSRQLPSRSGEEVILDGNDNVLLSHGAMRAGRPEIWEHQLYLYWSNIRAFFDRQILLSSQELGFPVFRNRSEFNLKTVETYWEFQHDDAIFAVVSLRRRMQALSSDISVNNYPVSTDSISNNSLSIRIMLTSSIRCTLYAKTSKRVRLEIRHNLMESAIPIGGAHTTNDAGQVLVWLQEVAQDASQRAGEVLGHLRSQFSTNSPQRPVYELLSRIALGVPNEETYHMIISMLVNTNRISVMPRDPLRSVVIRLLRMGVLERPRPRVHVFSIHTEFENALTELRGADQT